MHRRLSIVTARRGVLHFEGDALGAPVAPKQIVVGGDIPHQVGPAWEWVARSPGEAAH